ncbi:MAG TPA: hypothetical protein DCE42_07940 [Myxococcales bacterium]|nr:hypothetical protein [Deltaproteobacteria bacterium]HAA54674.1 hypothetical protein [Myxococcales bacterium]
MSNKLQTPPEPLKLCHKQLFMLSTAPKLCHKQLLTLSTAPKLCQTNSKRLRSRSNFATSNFSCCQQHPNFVRQSLSGSRSDLRFVILRIKTTTTSQDFIRKNHPTKNVAPKHSTPFYT